MVSIKYIDLRIRTSVYELKKFQIDCPWMNIMLSGKLEYIVNDTPVVLKEGQALYFKTGEWVSRCEQTGNVRYLSMRFTTDIDDACMHRLIPIAGQRQNTLVALLQSYYFGSELGESENRKAAESVLDLILQEFRANCSRTETNERVVAIQNYVLRNFHSGIKPHDVAKHLALHPSYCNTFYKNATGETIGQLIDRVRITHATSRLMYSRLSVREIASECGFKDTYYFSRWFTGHTSLSPMNYRNQNLEK